MKILLFFLLIAPASFSLAQNCSQVSPQHKNTLVELFTSDGCDSCPPANQWLSELVRGSNSSIVPLSLHVTYWNYLGWVDRFSDKIFDQQQVSYAQTAINKFAYTPEVFVNGKEWRHWRSRGELADLVAKNSKTEATIKIVVSAERLTGGEAWMTTLHVSSAGGKTTGQLFLALYEDDLSTVIKSGENKGSVLHHDRVVRKWWGPMEFSGEGLQKRQGFVMENQWNPKRMGIVAIVKSATGETLQTLALPLCGA